MLAAVLLVDEDVGRLHVAVDEAAAVSCVERIGDLCRDRHRSSRIQYAFTTEQCLQVGAHDEPHRDEQAPVGLARLVDRDHIGWSSPAARRDSRSSRSRKPSSSASAGRSTSVRPGARGSDRAPDRPRPCRRGRRALRSRSRRRVCRRAQPRSSRRDSHASRRDVEAGLADGGAHRRPRPCAAAILSLRTSPWEPSSPAWPCSRQRPTSSTARRECRGLRRSSSTRFRRRAACPSSRSHHARP